MRRRRIPPDEPTGDPICLLTPDVARIRQAPIDRVLERADYRVFDDGYENDRGRLDAPQRADRPVEVREQRRHVRLPLQVFEEVDDDRDPLGCPAIADQHQSDPLPLEAPSAETSAGGRDAWEQAVASGGPPTQ